MIYTHPLKAADNLKYEISDINSRLKINIPTCVGLLIAIPFYLIYLVINVCRMCT